MSEILNQRPKSLVNLKYLFSAFVAASAANIAGLTLSIPMSSVIKLSIVFVFCSLLTGFQLYKFYNARYSSRALLLTFSWIVLLFTVFAGFFMMITMPLTQCIGVLIISLIALLMLVSLYQKSTKKWAKLIKSTNSSQTKPGISTDEIRKNLKAALQTRPRSVLLGISLIFISIILSWLFAQITPFAANQNNDSLRIIFQVLIFLPIAYGLYKGSSIALFLALTVPTIFLFINIIFLILNMIEETFSMWMLYSVIPAAIYVLMLKFTLFHSNSKDWFRLCNQIRKSKPLLPG